MKKLVILVLLLINILVVVAMSNIVRYEGNVQIIEFENNEFTISQDGEFTIISAQNSHVNEISGEANLPYYLFQVSTPDDFTPTVKLNILESKSIKLTKDIQPIPKIEKYYDSYQYKYQINEEKYQTHKPQVQIIDNQNFRRISFAEIKFNPFKYNYTSKTLEAITKAELIISIPETKSSSLYLDDFEQKFLANLTNPNNIHLTNRPINNPYFTDFSIANHWYKIEINQDGVYSLTYSNLQSSLPVNDIDPRNIRIFTTGGEKLSELTADDGSPFREIPLLIEGEADGSFDSGDRIIFYARDRNDYDYLSKLGSKFSINPYSDAGIYWLSYDAVLDSLPLRMDFDDENHSTTITRSNNPQNSRYEREFYKRLQTNLYWYSNFLTGTATNTNTFNLTISDLDESDNNENSFVKAVLIEEYNGTAYSSKRHQASISLNSIPVSGNITWYGYTYKIIEEQTSSLVNGANSVGVTINRTNQDNLYLDYIQIQYMKKNKKYNGTQLAINFRDEDLGGYVRYSVEGSFSNNTRVFSTDNIYETKELNYNIKNDKLYFSGLVQASDNNQSDYFVPKFYVTNNDYLSATIYPVSPTDIISTSSHKESIIIYPEVFQTQALRLKEIYENTYNSSSSLVKLSDVFNQFSGGMDDPTAIRNFLSYMYSLNAGRRLKYVTLLGIGTYDWKGYKTISSEKNKMIIYQNGNSGIGDAVTSDDYFAYLTQTTKPELAVGRYPAKNTSELDMMIDEFEAYSAKDFAIDWWRNTGLFVADDFKNGSSTSETSHTTQLDKAVENAPKSLINKRIYAYQYEPDEFGKKPAARSDFIKALNKGALLTFYTGHGSYDQLGSEAYFRQGIDSAQLTNDDKRTFFISAACDVSQFDSPDFDCLSSDLLKYEAGGAIATWGATRISMRDANNLMVGTLLYFALDNREDIGTAILLTKSRGNGGNVNQSKYILFGDPHLKIIPPTPRMNIVFENENNSFQARETVIFSGNLNNNNIQTSQILAFQSDSYIPLSNTEILLPGSYIFNGESSVSNSEYSSAFVVPDDIVDGEFGKILVYAFDSLTKEEVLDYVYPVEFSGQNYNVVNESAPDISIWLESYDFRDGDVVSQNPLLLVDISDDNGINVSGGSGHQLLLMIDDDFNSFNLTPYFKFDIDSYQTGKIEFPISNLTPGNHTLKILAFDNLNKPAVKTTSFNVSESSELSISDILPYPNPMPKRGGDFTFMISNDALIKIDIYTLTGKKVNSLNANVTKGFNKISWNGRDKQGDKLANNTYFYIIKANAEGKTVTARGKFIILG